MAIDPNRLPEDIAPETRERIEAGWEDFDPVAEADVADPYQVDPDTGEGWIEPKPWDIWIGSEKVRSVEALMRYLEIEKLTVEEFKQLDVYLWNVEHPRYGWLKAL